VFTVANPGEPEQQAVGRGLQKRLASASRATLTHLHSFALKGRLHQPLGLLKGREQFEKLLHRQARQLTKHLWLIRDSHEPKLSSSSLSGSSYPTTPSPISGEVYW
jgi:hypothetical protein